MNKFKFEKDKIIAKNINIDKELIKKNELLEKELIELGVKDKPRYNLCHPLNTSTAYFYKK